MTPADSAVVDASALGALIFNEASAPQVLEQIRGHALHAPGMIFHELTNVAWKKARRLPVAEANIVHQELALGLQHNIRLHEVDHSQVLTLALATGLTAYDAAYLWLSWQLNIALVTLDKALSHAASQPR